MLEREFFTLLDDSVKRTAELCGIKLYVTWNIIMYRVDQALDKIDLSGMKLLYIDETLSKKDHNYVTVICNKDRRIIFICEGKSLEIMDRFTVWLEAHNGKRNNIGFVSYGIGKAYPLDAP